MPSFVKVGDVSVQSPVPTLNSVRPPTSGLDTFRVPSIVNVSELDTPVLFNRLTVGALGLKLSYVNVMAVEGDALPAASC